MGIQNSSGRRDVDFACMLVVGEEAEGADDGGLEAVAGGAALEFPKVRVEDAGTTAGDEAIEKARGQDMLDGIAAIMATDAAVGWIAADEFADGLAVAELAGDSKAVAGVRCVFWMAAAGEDLLGGFLSEGFRGFQ